MFKDIVFLGNTGIGIRIRIIGTESFTTLEKMEITVVTQGRAEDPQIKELDRRRVNKAQSTDQNKGLNNDVQNACELLINKILQNLFRLNQA